MKIKQIILGSILLIGIVTCNMAIGQIQTTNIPNNIGTPDIKTTDIKTIINVKEPLSVGKAKNKIEFDIKTKNSNQTTFSAKLLKKKTETISESCLKNHYESSGTINSWKIFDSEGNSSISDIVPGAIYDLSVFDGDFFPEFEEKERQPIWISLTKSVQSTVTKSKVTNPQLSEVIRDQGIKPIQIALKKNVFGPTLRITTDFQRQFSSRDLNIALGGSIPYLAGVVKFSNENHTSSQSESFTYLLELEEEFYTLKATGQKIADKNFFISPPANISNFAYISSVTYGRKIIVIIESSTEMSAASNSFSVSNSGAVNASIKSNSNSAEKSKTFSYKIFLAGGNNNYSIPLGTQSGTIDDLLNSISKIISKGNANSKDAVPIKFTMKDLNGNTMVSTYRPYETEVEACQPKFKIILEQLEVKKVTDGGSTDKKLELFGSFKVSAYNSLTNKVEIYDVESTTKMKANTPISAAYAVARDNSGKTFFASKESPISRAKNIPKRFDSNTKEAGGDIFALTNNVTDDGYFIIKVNAVDKDKLSKNDELNKVSQKIYFKDIGGDLVVPVSVTGKSGTIEFTFKIEKIN